MTLMTPSVDSRTSLFALLSSFNLKRRRVMQCATEMILLLPPTFWMMIRARPSYLLAISRFSFLHSSYACAVNSSRSLPLFTLTAAMYGSAASAEPSARLSSLRVRVRFAPRRTAAATFASPPASGYRACSSSCGSCSSCIISSLPCTEHTKLCRYSVKPKTYKRSPRAPGRGYISKKEKSPKA